MRTLQIGMLALVLGLAGPARAGVTLILADDTVGPDTAIVFTVENGTDETIQFGSSAPYSLKNLDTGEFVPFVGLTVMIPLPAGETAEFVIPGGTVEPGTYELSLHYFDKVYATHVLGAELTVTQDDAQTPATSSTVGRAKARYHQE